MSARGQVERALDALDGEILAALLKRLETARALRTLRTSEGLPADDPERDRATLARAVEAAEPAERDAVAGVFERVLAGGRGVVETIARGVCVRDGRVLLCRGKGAKSTYLPGGHIEFGETARAALVREMREETGLEAEAGAFLGVVENSFLQHGRPHCEINLVYAMTLPEARDGACPAREHWISFSWCDVNALDGANLLPADMRTLVVSARRGDGCRADAP